VRLSAKPYPTRVIDVSQRGDVAKRAGAFDAVIHCASSRGGDAEAYREIYLNGARHLLETFPQAKILFTSSAIGKVVRLRPEELADAPFLFYPKGSNMRLSIDRFFHEIGITPRVIMEADDTEAIKRLVESGFGYSILPEFSLRGQGRFLELFRVAGHRLVRRQALAMPRTMRPRPPSTAPPPAAPISTLQIR
jgi:DNA-binding transcriptional LysR family regulator